MIFKTFHVIRVDDKRWFLGIWKLVWNKGEEEENKTELLFLIIKFIIIIKITNLQKCTYIINIL